MRENAIFLCKDSFILSGCSNMINVSINGSYALEVVDFGNSFGSSEIFRAALGIAHGRSVLVLLVRDNVMANTVQVVCCGESGCLGAPWVRCCRILFVF